MIPFKKTIHVRLSVLFVLVTFLGNAMPASSADDGRLEEIRMKMDDLSRRCPEFSESVDVSVGRMRLSELLRMVAGMKKVNLSVRDDFDCIVSCSFTRSRIDDLILFLCREYDLEIEVFGNIVSVFKYSPPEEPSREPEISCSPSDTLISFHLKDMILGDVLDRISALTGESVIVPAGLRQSVVTATAEEVSVGDALEILAMSNGLQLYTVQGDRMLWCMDSDRDEREQYPHRRVSSRGTGVQSDTTAILSLRHRSIENMQSMIPEGIKDNVRMIESNEMNAFIIHGDSELVSKVEAFIRRIDVPVPMVEIDVLIVESSKSTSRDIGLTAGFSEGKASMSGTVSPGMDLSLGTEATLQLMNKIDGFSSINLGDAADRLFMEIRLLEEAGLVKVESTPKLATLNGQKAILTRGETTHYKEVSSSFYSSQTTVENQSFTWKEVNADLVITITPHVSLDSLVTLNIDIKQDEFGSRVSADAPPDINRRGFQSIVRVSDGDVVLLGGIDTSSDETTASGLPWLARIPVLRWVGGNDKRAKSEQKMNVFIRPKIIN